MTISPAYGYEAAGRGDRHQFRIGLYIANGNIPAVYTGF